MRSGFLQQIQSIIGIGLLLLSILGFLLLVLLSLPKSAQVQSQAKLLKSDPDLFSSSNPVNQQIRNLKVPANIPVVVGQDELGRNDVFQNF